MKPVVLIADEHIHFLTRLAERLRALAENAYEVRMIPSAGESDILFSVKGLQRDLRLRVAVFLYPNHLPIASILSELPGHVCLLGLCENMRDGTTEEIAQPLFRAMIETETNAPHAKLPHHTDQPPGCEKHGAVKIGMIPRFTRARKIDRIIRSCLSGEEVIPPGGKSSACRIGTHLSFSEDAGSRVTRYLIRKEKSLGHTVVYLPIKPLYQIDDRFRRGCGQTIGDLICRLSTGDIPGIENFGKWLYMHESGYYTFSMPERSDDIITCDINTLRQIIGLLRDYTHSRTQPTTSWIDIGCLPLAKVLELAVLCDFLYVDAPSGPTDKEEAARRELGLFMARLPKSCDILELPRHRHRGAAENGCISSRGEPSFASEL